MACGLACSESVVKLLAACRVTRCRARTPAAPHMAFSHPKGLLEGSVAGLTRILEPGHGPRGSLGSQGLSDTPVWTPRNESVRGVTCGHACQQHSGPACLWGWPGPRVTAQPMPPQTSDCENSGVCHTTGLSVSSCFTRVRLNRDARGRVSPSQECRAFHAKLLPIRRRCTNTRTESDKGEEEAHLDGDARRCSLLPGRSVGRRAGEM